ncbi:GNAT family N-acetyltransferase [Mangrovibacillus cuniculi]|uniref:GNAT family N-acetyltransferase n=1 Tax=Mangrovibacillus cuniculi TaxID=2593652 RepID=A0A7S8C9G4_9BACI|nr:GNAT family N-acetyltransferase [Mangrovibacillus cuniculi]QPC45872.1 GNAT family N-acetyltransferase [Mangrovibacillus cuniculi]
MKLRIATSSDFDSISPLLNVWWGGRQMVDMLPRLFFQHFSSTSLVMEQDDEIIGFLVGLLSQDHVEEAYIHFVGVHPNHRKKNIAKVLYEEFYEIAKDNERSIVRCVTSPVNKASVAFHTKIGFEVEEGDKLVDGVDVHTNYDGNGQDRVLFWKQLKYR